MPKSPSGADVRHVAETERRAQARQFGDFRQNEEISANADCVVGLGGLEPGDKHAVVSNLSPNGRCCDQMSLD